MSACVPVCFAWLLDQVIYLKLRSKAWLATYFGLPHSQLRISKVLRTRNRTQLAFLMVATRKRTRNFIKFIYHLILKLAISALISILASLELVKNGFFWVKNCFNCWNLQFLSYRNVIYIKKGILILLYCLKTCEVAIALRKSKNAPRARTSQVS